MGQDRRNYASGTYLDSRMPWGVYVGGAVLCSDGKVRKLARIAQTADTFFSVPASVQVQGKTVAGYVTVETLAGFSTETESDPAVAKFVAYSHRKNGHLLPGLAYRSEHAAS